MLLQLDAFHLRVGEVDPAKASGDGLRLAGEVRPFISHLQEQQECQLFEVVLIAEAVVSETLAIAPQLLDDAFAPVAHTAPVAVRTRLVLLGTSAARSDRMLASSLSAGSSVGS